MNEKQTYFVNYADEKEIIPIGIETRAETYKSDEKYFVKMF